MPHLCFWCMFWGPDLWELGPGYNFLGLPSESQGLSPLGGAVGPLDVCGSTRVALGSPSGDRMHSESGPGSYKVIGPAHVPAMVPQRSSNRPPVHRA